MENKVYTVYKTTNTINGKYYIGVHKTSNPYDDYIGSGKILKRAIEKYGRENFTKEIINTFETPEEAYLLESQLVTFELIESKDSYNLKEGGQGGFDYINKENLNDGSGRTKGALVRNKLFWDRYNSDIDFYNEMKQKMIDGSKKGVSVLKDKYPEGIWKNKNHTDETKQKMSLVQSNIDRTGNNNPQYGKIWITDGINNKMIKKEELDFWIEKGYYKGRKQ